MNKNLIPLCKLPIGSLGIIKKITLTGILRRKLLDLGFIKDSIICPVHKSPLGDPIAYQIKGTIIALRNNESGHIHIKVI